MATGMEELFNTLAAGQVENWAVTLLNQYFPYGMFFWMVGFGIWVVSQAKTKNFGYSSAFASVYFVTISGTGLVYNAWSVMFMRYFGLFIGILAGLYLYKSTKGGSAYG